MRLRQTNMDFIQTLIKYFIGIILVFFAGRELWRSFSEPKLKHKGRVSYEKDEDA